MNHNAAISLADNNNNNSEPEIHLTNAGNDLFDLVPMAPPPVVASEDATLLTPSSKVAGSDDANFKVLRQQGYPRGLAQELVDMIKTYPIRFWILDNSTSMETKDGVILLDTISKDDIQVVPSTRWKELQGTVTYHAQLAGLLQAKTVFRLLNDPGKSIGPQEFSINERHAGFIDREVLVAQNCMNYTKPRGSTPLTHHINVVRERTDAMASALRRDGQQAVVVLATDGMPTTNDNEEDIPAFVQSLNALQALPVRIIVRLCTNEESVVKFYNNIDAQLGSPIDVIDDFFGEAKEISEKNNWLNYTLPLHRCRELGYRNCLFDLLDERQLTKDELFEFLVLLFGKDTFENAPNIHTDWNGFIKVLTKVVANEGKHGNPVTRKPSLLIDIGRLEKAYGTRGTRLFGW